MAAVWVFVSEWQGFADTVRALQVEVLTLSGMPDSVAGSHGTHVAESVRL